MNIQAEISQQINNHIEAVETFRDDSILIDNIGVASKLIADALSRGNKVITFGNGGSAADAEHMVAELVGRFKLQRSGLRALSLTSNGAIMTSLSNDFGYENAFARQLEGVGTAGDVAVGISTSGSSVNVVRALTYAKSNDMVTIGLTGGGGGEMNALCQCLLDVPTVSTQHIQECHGLIYHIICDIVERMIAD